MKIEIFNIIKIVRSADFYGGGEFIEIAKGKNQLATTFKHMKRKLKRLRK